MNQSPTGAVRADANAVRTGKRKPKEQYLYVPVDEWLLKPRTRMLRALRWFPDGLSAQDIGDVLGLEESDASEHSAERAALTQALGRSLRAGEIVRLKIAGIHWLYKLAPGFQLQPPPPPAIMKRRAA